MKLFYYLLTAGIFTLAIPGQSHAIGAVAIRSRPVPRAVALPPANPSIRNTYPLEKAYVGFSCGNSVVDGLGNYLSYTGAVTLGVYRNNDPVSFNCETRTDPSKRIVDSGGSLLVRLFPADASNMIGVRIYDPSGYAISQTGWAAFVDGCDGRTPVCRIAIELSYASHRPYSQNGSPFILQPAIGQYKFLFDYQDGSSQYLYVNAQPDDPSF